MTDERCGEQYDRHPTKPHLSAVCTRPRGHDGEHSNVLHKPGEDPDWPLRPRVARPCPVCGGAGIVDTSPPGVDGSAP